MMKLKKLVWIIIALLMAYHTANASPLLHRSPEKCSFDNAAFEQLRQDIGAMSNRNGATFGCDNNFFDVYIDRRTVNDLHSLQLNNISEHIREPFRFAGLAAFYNSVRGVTLNTESSHSTTTKLPLKVQNPSVNEWYGLQGRYEILLIRARGSSVQLEESQANIQFPEGSLSELGLYLGPPEVATREMSTDKTRQTDFSILRYSHLWPWLATLCKAVEWLLQAIQGLVTNWGLAIIGLAIALKILLLPVSMMGSKLQNEVNRKQAILEPKLAHIKANYDGEDAHNRLMAEYKALDISPFFTLKPLLATLVQLPFLIAAFNVLGETPLVNGQGFLWIKDLAYPDAIADLPMTIPMLGATVNLLPFIMAAVTILATLTFSVKHASIREAKKQRRNLYLMSAAFFFLFYPFPAAMVLYWTMTNALQLLQQRLLSSS